MGVCASHLQEICLTAHRVPKQGKMNSYRAVEDRLLHVRRVELTRCFPVEQKGKKKKEANRSKFTKLSFLLFEIGKGSLGNNDQV